MMVMMMMMIMRRLSSLRVRAKPRHFPYIYIYLFIFIYIYISPPPLKTLHLHAICSIWEAPPPNRIVGYIQHLGGSLPFVCYLQHLKATTLPLDPVQLYISTQNLFMCYPQHTSHLIYRSLFADYIFLYICIYIYTQSVPMHTKIYTYYPISLTLACSMYPQIRVHIQIHIYIYTHIKYAHISIYIYICLQKPIFTYIQAVKCIHRHVV